MIIAQITDFHVTAPGALCYGQVPTNDPAYGLVSHLSFVPAHETFQPRRGRSVREVLERFAGRYDELNRREYEALPAR